MSGFDLTSFRFDRVSSTNKRPLTAPPPPPPPKEMECRVCETMFLDAQSLIDHMHTHLMEQNLIPPPPAPPAPLPRRKANDFRSQKPTSTFPSSSTHMFFDITSPTRLTNHTTSLCPSFFAHQFGLGLGDTSSNAIPPLRTSAGCTQSLQAASLLGVKRHPTGASSSKKQRKVIRNEAAIDLPKSDAEQLENPRCDVRKGSDADDEGNPELETLDLSLKL